MMINAQSLQQQCAGRWFSIYQHFGINVGTGKHQKCPLCGGKDRFRVDRDGATYYCNQCNPGTGITLVRKHLGVDFPETLKRINEVIKGGYTMDTVQDNVMSVDEKKKMLNRIWESSKPLMGSDPACAYLHERGLVLQPDFVRYCPECYNSDTKKPHPAIVAKILNKDGQPIAIHRTYLDDVPKKKKVTPSIGSIIGGAIRLFPIESDILGIAEGIETAIACVQLFDIPVWACISSTIMEGFEPPKGIRQVIICGDSDANFAGQRAAYILAQKLYNKDFLTEVRLPNRTGQDFNDILIKNNQNNA